ncbi:MAG: hypothetical protein WBP16_14280 [Ferruginibacter sp.]
MVKKLIGVFIILAIIVVCVYAWREYNRKPADLTDAKPAFTITAENLSAEFENDETSANKKYLGKLVQVNGVIASAVYVQDTLINIVLGDGLHKVGCQFDKKHAAGLQHYQEMNTITVKGICTGYLMDVEMNRCVIVK